MNDPSRTIDSEWDMMAQWADLPFVDELAGDMGSWWSVKPVGNVADDIARGADYGELALATAKERNTALPIAFVMRDMIRAGSFTPLEVGFLTVIVSAAHAGSYN